MTTQDFRPLYLLSFSGGKDSVAAWLHLERDRGERVRCVYVDTGWEWAGHYDYLDLLEFRYGCPLVRIRPQVRDIYYDRRLPVKMSEEEASNRLDMYELVRRKCRPPSSTKRFCTSILKLAPLRRYVQSIEGPLVMCSGVRAEESKSRAMMPPRGYDEFMGCDRELPIHAWTVADVFAIHNKYGVPPNPLYKMGCSRVGCFPCINARKAEIALVASIPEARRRVIQLEKDFGFTWFRPGTASKAYQSRVDQKSGKRINTADDVFRWSTGQQPAYKADGLFAGMENGSEYPEEEVGERVCSSVYGLCE